MNLAKSKAKVGLCLLLVVSTGLVFGFGNLSAATPREDTLVLASISGRTPSPGNWNQAASWISPARGYQNLVMSPLWMVEPYDRDDPRTLNVLAKAPAEYQNDGKKVVVKLREGIYWSDGVEFTAEDVVYTTELMKQNPGLRYHTQIKQNVEEVHKNGDYEVVFNLKDSNYRFHQIFVDRWGSLRPLPKHVWEKVEDPMTFKFNPPIGPGPYKLKDYDPQGNWFTFERREDWQRTAAGKLFGKPKPKYVRFQNTGGSTSTALNIIRGKIDWAGTGPQAFKAAMTSNAPVRGWFGERFYPAVIGSTCPTGATFNTQKFPYSEKDVRWALILSMDVVDATMDAFGSPITYTPAFLAINNMTQEHFHEPLQSWLKEFTLEVGEEEIQPYDTGIPLELAKQVAKTDYDFEVPESEETLHKQFGYGWWEHSPEAAAKLLKEHGFTRKDGKWYLPSGDRWEVPIICDSSPGNASYKWAIGIAKQWREFGIKAYAQPLETVDTRETRGNFAVGTSAWPATESWGTIPDLHRVLDPYHSKYAVGEDEPVVGHESRWHDEELDEIVDKMETVPSTSDENVELGMEGLKEVIKDAPGISIGNSPNYLLWNTTYWKGWPDAEDPYMTPFMSWGNLRFTLTKLEKSQ